jgi:perosamine synthetase
MAADPRPKIPVASVDLSGNEERYVVDALRSTWVSSTGEYLNRFEREFAAACGTKSAIAVCNGTVALHLALLGMDVRPGDEVLVPSLTYVATANAVRYVGGEPVFVDIDPHTWCLDPEKLEGAITRRTKGIIAVHLLGHPADMDRINRVAAVHGLWVVEDAAEAVFARYKSRPVGGLARAATFSFFGNKVLTCGEGGAVTLDDPGLVTRLKALRGQGMDPDRRYYFPITGYNFRLTNLAAALLCAQVERADQILARRREIFALYNRRMAEIPGVLTQPIAPWVEHSPWLYACTIDSREFGATRDELITHLAERGIETRPMFIPLHTLPPFREESRQRGDDLPETVRLGSTGIMLPTYNRLADADVVRVTDAITALHRERSARVFPVRKAA